MTRPPLTRRGDGATESAADLYRAMVGLGLLCGLAIVSVFVATQPRIARKRAIALEHAIHSALPGTERTVPFVETSTGQLERATENAPRGDRVYAGYDRDGRLVGIAVEASGVGYQDVISVLYGYSLERHAIVGLEILSSLETPGLGDRIRSDPEFRANFTQLDVRLDASGSAIAHPITAVKHGEKREPWQVDGITGATISSVAVADLLRASTARWIPKLERQADQLRKGG